MNSSTRNSLFRMLAALLACAAMMATPALAANKTKFSAFQHGKPVGYLPCATLPLRNRAAALIGGGRDVEPALGWMIAKMTECANGATGVPGNFLVIRAGGNPSYDSYIYKLGTVASVVTIVVPTVEAANDPAMEPYIRSAGAIFLTGGDQGDYYNFWKGSLLERLVSEHVAAFGVPVGGTSAGMMILSEFNYIAYPLTITSPTALADPYTDGAVTIKSDFWANRTPFGPLLNTVTDSHFDTRDRMGRLTTFLGRVIADGQADIADARAIGVDEQTALLLEFSNTAAPGTAPVSARTVANPGIAGAAYLLYATPGSALVVTPGQPLTFTDIGVQKLSSDGSIAEYSLDVQSGTMTSSTGSIY